MIRKQIPLLSQFVLRCRIEMLILRHHLHLHLVPRMGLPQAFLMALLLDPRTDPLLVFLMDLLLVSQHHHRRRRRHLPILSLSLLMILSLNLLHHLRLIHQNRIHPQIPSNSESPTLPTTPIKPARTKTK